MIHPLRKLLSAGVAAVMMLGSIPAIPAAASDAVTLKSGIWMLEKGTDKLYYLLKEDGKGEICAGKKHSPIAYTQADSKVTISYLQENRIPEQLSLRIQDDTYYAQIADSEYRMIYLQPVTEADSTRCFTPGDMTQDGNFSIYDSTLVLRYLIGTYPMSNVQMTLADFNNDHVVNAIDLTLIKQALIDPSKLPDEPDEPDEPTIEQKVMLNAIEYSQHPAYPTGCESIALYILLKYYDTDVTPAQIIEALPKGPLPSQSNGALYGANPEREFVGDPTTNYSYGVFNEPIAQTAELFRAGVITEKNVPLESIFPIISSGQPVIAWYTTTPDRDIIYKNSWYDYETGELIKWPGGEHAVVVCGYDLDAGTLTYRDPNTGGSNTLPIEKFRKIYDELGGRIVYYNE